jgi:predicted AlkP superfamily phosphohydrolase/phosphomutase
MGRDVQATRLWDRVTDAGMQASVMNVPVTFPPQRNVQRMVSGFLSPGIDKAAAPEEFRQYLEDDGYLIDANARLGHDDDKTEFIENANRTLERRQSAFMNYLTADDWDLFFGVFMTTDRVNHFLFEHYEKDGEYREEFLDFYETLDGYIGEIRETIPDDVTLMVASDHGFTTLEYEVNCNEWLRRHNWLDYQSDPEGLEDIAADARAYSLIPGRFYLNLEDREPNGVVPEADYESVRDELRADLEEMEAPDGQPVARRVVDGEVAFDGDHAEIAPDLVIIPENGYDLKSGFSEKDDVFSTGPRNGMHSFENTSLFIDSDEATIGDADLLDIAPTILEFLDIEQDAAEFDGRSLV